MAKSKYEYVREFESATDHRLLQDSYIVVRIDGQGFHRFTKEHNFLKPNDKRCLDLMNKSALHVMRSFYPNIIFAYGQSDEYSFVLRRLSNIFNRRQCKISSLITSAFTSAFVFYWPQYFSTQNQSKLTFRKFEDYNSDVKSLLSESSTQLRYPPSFDGRCVLYPNERTLLDYLKWRQVDCHINNLYNTVFYALTGEYSRYTGKPDGGFNVYLPETKPFTSGRQYHSHQDATKILSGSSSGDKNEILFSSYGINYNNELEQFRKGTIFTLDIPANVSKEIETLSSEKQTKSTIRKLNEIQENFVNLDVTKQESFFRLLNVDIIGESFWETYGHLLQL